MLDARPMPGSKRIPNMDVAANGTMALEMWCNRVDGQVVDASQLQKLVAVSHTVMAALPAIQH